MPDLVLQSAPQARVEIAAITTMIAAASMPSREAGTPLSATNVFPMDASSRVA